jgi:hypothetical protein
MDRNETSGIRIDLERDTDNLDHWRSCQPNPDDTRVF